MTRHAVRNIGRILAILACVCPLAALPAFAAGTVPVGARVRVDRAVDLLAFERSVARSYDVTFRRVIATDIDRDGDVDVVGSTERDFVVWVNDGHGHLTSQSPTRPAAVDGTPRATTWREGEPRRDESIQNDLPSPRLAGVYAHAPPERVGALFALASASLPSRTDLGYRTPRAPPVHVTPHFTN